MSAPPIFSARLHAGSSEPLLSAEKLLGRGSYGDAFEARVAPTPFSRARLPFPPTVVVKRATVGKMLEPPAPSLGPYALTAHAFPEARIAVELGGRVPWGALLDEEAALQRASSAKPTQRASASASASSPTWGDAAATSTVARAKVPIFPTFFGASFARESPSSDAKVFHLLALESFGNDLNSWILGSPKYFRNHAVLRNIAHQIFSLLAELHGASGLIHRDVKPQNILLNFSPSPANYPLLRLCDLGTARVPPLPLAAYASPAPTVAAGEKPLWDDNLEGAASPYVCSLWYRAPELLLGSAFYGPPVDVWAAVITVAELFSLSETLNNEASAAALTSRRTDGKKVSLDKKTGKPVYKDAKDSREGAVAGAGADGSDAGAAPTDSAEELVTIFHCGPNDAYAVLAQVSALGIPTKADASDMRLPSSSLKWIDTLSQTLHAKNGRRGGSADPSSPLPLAELLAKNFFVPADVAAVLARVLVWAPSARPTAAELAADKVWLKYMRA